MQRQLVGLLTALVLAGAVWMPFSASAEEEKAPQLTIGVTVQTEGVNPEPGEVSTIKLVADEPESPMPADAEGGECTIKINKEGAFLPILYEKAGVYHYRVYQQIKKAHGWAYDESVYILTVVAAYKKDGGLEVSVTAHKEGQEEKEEKLVFINRGVSYPLPPQTGDGVSLWLWLSVVGFWGCLVLSAGKIRFSDSPKD